MEYTDNTLDVFQRALLELSSQTTTEIHKLLSVSLEKGQFHDHSYLTQHLERVIQPLNQSESDEDK